MDENIFEINDLSNMQLINVNGINIYYMDNFYKYPDKVYEYINSIPSQLWKIEEPYSYNNIYFEDRRHFVKDERLKETVLSLSKIIKRRSLYEDTLITNFSRFIDHPFNDYKKCFWSPHIDDGYNAIIYLNKDINEEHDGTNIYYKLTDYIPPHGEHHEPWQKKEHWHQVVNIRALYNRIAIFDGKYYHAMNISDKKFFGNTLNEAKFRINQVIFFD